MRFVPALIFWGICGIHHDCRVLILSNTWRAGFNPVILGAKTSEKRWPFGPIHSSIHWALIRIDFPRGFSSTHHDSWLVSMSNTWRANSNLVPESPQYVALMTTLIQKLHLDSIKTVNAVNPSGFLPPNQLGWLVSDSNQFVYKTHWIFSSTQIGFHDCTSS